MVVVSKEAFRVVDPVFTFKSFKEKKLFSLIFAFGMFFLTVLFVVFQHALLSGSKSEDDTVLLNGLKSEIGKLPFKR